MKSFFLIFWLSLGSPGAPGPKIVKIIFIHFYGIRETGIRGVIVTRQPAASTRDNGFSVLRIFLTGVIWAW